MDNPGQDGIFLHQNGLFVDNPGQDGMLLHQNGIFVDNCAVESVLRCLSLKKVDSLQAK